MRKITILVMAVMVAFGANAAERYLKATLHTSTDSAKYGIAALERTQLTALETTAKGRLWASVLCGGDGANGFLTLAYSDDKGAQWVEPILALDARDKKLAVRNGMLWYSPKGEMWLFYTVFDGYYDGRGSLWAVACKNPDEVEPVWGEPKYLGVGVATGRPMVNSAGEWVLPAALWGREVMEYDKALYISNKWNTPRFMSPYIDKYHELDEKRGAGVYISCDGGESWQENMGVVKCSNEVVAARYNNPQLFHHSDGSMRMVVRASGTAWSYVSTSVDGKSWSAPVRFVAAPDQNFAVRRLADGRLLMVRNARFDRELYWRPEGMYAYLSEDCGATWYGGLRLASDLVTINPIIAEANDGTIYIATYNDPEVECKNMLCVTSVAEIDAAHADYNNSPKQNSVVLTAGGAAAVAEEETKRLTAPRSDWSSESIRIATFNIQYPVNSWSEKRLPAAVALLKEYKFDVFGAQEPYLHQIEDLVAQIGKEYDWIGTNVSGDNSDRKHHFNPIFYRRERVELLDYDTVWLSDAVGKPGYGARSARLFTWAKFRDKVTGKVFFLFNGHYDHRGHEAKVNSSFIVLNMVRHISKGLPAFVTADYNANEKSEAYRVLQESPLLEDTMLGVANPINAKYQSHAEYRPAKDKPANGMHIDHIFYTPNSVRVNEWKLIIEEFAGYYASDHLPIYVDCFLAN